jgi:thiamine pyrophosphate-dependent acetolactate synthase large subunit-like protein
VISIPGDVAAADAPREAYYVPPPAATIGAALKAPIDYTLKGKRWLEHDNPNAVGMTGLLGYGGCWDAINHADVLIMLGADFPFSDFLPPQRRQDHPGRAESESSRAAAGLAPFGTEFVNPDFSKVAEACGAKGTRLEEPGDVREGLQAALRHKDGPVVVDVLVERYALSLPSHVPVETVKGFTLSLAKQALAGKTDDVIEHNVRLL